MKYYNLKSIIAATKTKYSLRTESESFYIAPKRDKPFIEPAFTKEEFTTERPSVILISAIGATGKTTLAQSLSNEIGLPLLDLGKHKPVADNTLTGLITNSFHVRDLSMILEGIGSGTFGVIIDGIDEGRSKTTEKAFEAFLDDIVRLCGNSTNTSFVLLGRTQILEYSWLYLTEKGTSTGLITISPFDLDQARNYIDKFTEGLNSQYIDQYIVVRDEILDILGDAFGSENVKNDNDFLSFIGYPPVLDAIATLLITEKNYHRLQQEIQESDKSDVEVGLLLRISNYIIGRERDLKVIPNIVTPLVSGMPDTMRNDIVSKVFNKEEQCERLVSLCLRRGIGFQIIDEQSVNEKYEEQLKEWLPEHPFIHGNQFRNAINAVQSSDLQE